MNGGHGADGVAIARSKYRASFTDFLYKYFDVAMAMKRREWWLAANILQQLLLMEANDYKLHQKYAQCLAYLYVLHYIH